MVTEDNIEKNIEKKAEIRKAIIHPMHSGKTVDIVKGGMKITRMDTGETRFIDLGKHSMNSLVDYYNASLRIKGDAPAMALSNDVIANCELDELARFENMLDNMEIPHFDCISYAIKEIHKYFKKYFTKPCCKTRISIGLKRYIEKFKPETKIYNPHKTPHLYGVGFCGDYKLYGCQCFSDKNLRHP